MTASGTPFTSAHVNQYIQGAGGRARILEFLTTAPVRVVTVIPFYSTTAIANNDWELLTGFEDVWSATRGYPRTVTFHAGRLYFGGSRDRPNTIWGSKIALFFDFDPGSSITGLIIGGGEVQSIPFSQGVGDIIDMSKLNGALAVNVALATDITGVLGVERLIGNNNIGSTLTGANQNNTWNISGSNRANVTSVDSLAGTMEVFDFHNLTGNLGRDDFSINDGFNLAGNINGVDYALNNS